MPSTIFSGSKVKTLKDTLTLNSKTDLISIDVDPSAGAGVAAPIGSLAMHQTTGVLYQKTGAGDTAWVVASSTGALNTSGGTMTGNITFNNGTGALTQTGLIVGSLLRTNVFTSGTSATFTPQAATRMILVEMWGGGGGGAGATLSTTAALEAGGAGGGGAYQSFIYKNVTGLTATYTVGSGGTGGNATAGAAGGNTVFIMDGYTRTSGGGGAGAIGSQQNSQADAQSGTPGVGGTVSGSGTVSARYSGFQSFSGQAGGIGAIALFSGAGAGTGTEGLIMMQAVGGGAYKIPPNRQVMEVGIQRSFGVDATFRAMGGNGGCNYNTLNNGTGGDGSAGLINIYEYA